MKGKIARFIEAISSLLLKMKNGKSQKRRRDFKENRKKGSLLWVLPLAKIGFFQNIKFSLNCY
jgi:hypothetical protein